MNRHRNDGKQGNENRGREDQERAESEASDPRDPDSPESDKREDARRDESNADVVGGDPKNPAQLRGRAEQAESEDGGGQHGSTASRNEGYRRTYESQQPKKKNQSRENFRPHLQGWPGAKTRPAAQ